MLQYGFNLHACGLKPQARTLRMVISSKFWLFFLLQIQITPGTGCAKRYIELIKLVLILCMEKPQLAELTGEYTR